MGLMDAVDRWYAANNAQDAAAVVAALAPEGTFEDPFTNGPISGAPLLALMVGVLQQFPDCRFEVESLGTTGEATAAAQWTMLATQASDGKAIVLRGADFFTWDAASDRLASVTGYFDQVALRTQLR